MSDTNVVYVRTGAGRIHIAAIVNDSVKVDESCNLDDAKGEREILTELPADVSVEHLCGRCFATSDTVDSPGPGEEIPR